MKGIDVPSSKNIRSSRIILLNCAMGSSIHRDENGGKSQPRKEQEAIFEISFGYRFHRHSSSSPIASLRSSRERCRLDLGLLVSLLCSGVTTLLFKERCRSIHRPRSSYFNHPYCIIS